jgi:tetratricopeptide (TPR) repeat protein
VNSELTAALYDYVTDTECPEKNYRLAGLYYGMGHTAAALTFYLRTAERTQDEALSYECLLVMGLCFEAQSDRDNSARGMFKQAIMFSPHRPEGYFLLARHYERARLYMDGYVTAEIGMRMSDRSTHPPLRGWVQYPGKYGLLFEKAVTAWWWGREAEARSLFRQLSREYYDTMDEPHRSSVCLNLVRLDGVAA